MSLFRTGATACIGFAVCAYLVLLAVGWQKESAEAYPLPVVALSRDMAGTLFNAALMPAILCLSAIRLPG